MYTSYEQEESGLFISPQNQSITVQAMLTAESENAAMQ